MDLKKNSICKKKNHKVNYLITVAFRMIPPVFSLVHGKYGTPSNSNICKIS